MGTSAGDTVCLPTYPVGVIVRPRPCRSIQCRGCDLFSIDDDTIFGKDNMFGVPSLPLEWSYYGHVKGYEVPQPVSELCLGGATHTTTSIYFGFPTPKCMSHAGRRCVLHWMFCLFPSPLLKKQTVCCSIPSLKTK